MKRNKSNGKMEKKEINRIKRMMRERVSFEEDKNIV